MSEPDEDPRLHDYAGWICHECARGDHENCAGIHRGDVQRRPEMRARVCQCPCPYPDTPNEEE